MKVIYILVGLIGVTFSATGQFGLERAAMNRMEKGKWADAETALRKAYRKDSVNTEVTYILSWYFSSASNPSLNIDSAYRYIMLSVRNYQRGTAKEREQLKRFPIDSATLLSQRKKVDSMGFERAKKVNTEDSYNDYLARFGTADRRDEAIELRDEVAFLNAMKINTKEGFERYLHRYPTSSRAVDAKQRFEKLLYLEKTHDGKLKSYESFYV